MSIKLSLLFLTASLGLYSQSCSFTYPASNQLIQTITPLQTAITVSSAPSAYKAIYSIDGLRFAEGFVKDIPQNYPDTWQSPFSVTLYPGLNGDGPHTVTASIQDIFGNVLGSGCSVSYTVRVMGMSSGSIAAVPLSSVGALQFLTPDGSTNAFDHYAAIDGMPLIGSDTYCGGSTSTSLTGGFQFTGFNPGCYPNGPRQVTWSYNTSQITDPYMLAKTFTSSNVSGNTVTFGTPHYSYQGSAVSLSTTGTLPSPLPPSCTYSSQTSSSGAGQSNTASYSIASGVITVTLSTACGTIGPGTSVLLRNIHYTDPTGLGDVCDGLYTMASGSGTSFTVNLPSNCLNTGGLGGQWQFEVIVNPVFVNSTSPTTLSFSATPNGPTIPLTNGGTGTHTILARVRSPVWKYYGDFFNQIAVQSGSAPIYVTGTYNFSNGSAPMEIEIPAWEIHPIIGGPSISICPKIKNADLSFTTLACNASGLGYTLVSDGPGSETVDASGNVSAATAGWGQQISVTCNATCAGNSGGLPPVTVYVKNETTSVAAPQFTHNGAVATAFSPGNSFVALGMWQLNPVYYTPYNGVSSTWVGTMMQESKLNSFMIEATQPGVNQDVFGDPAQTSCYSSWPTAWHSAEAAFANQYGLYYEAGIEGTHWGPYGAGNLAALLNNAGFNRQSCLTAYLNSLVTEGRTWRTYGFDELNAYMAGSYPFRAAALGSAGFPSITVSGGVAAYNVSETFNGVWNQAAGTGDWVKMAGAVTNTCLDAWAPVTGITTSGGYPVSFTTPTACANGTYTESAANLYHYWVTSACLGSGACENADTLPRLYGTGNDNNVQAWDSTYFTQIVVSGGVATFTMQAHGLVTGRAVRVHGSVNNLNVVAPVTVVDANHFTIAYSSLFGTVPSNGTYTSSNDAALFVTVDFNFPSGAPFLNLRNVLAAVTNHPATTWPILGSSFTAGNPAVQNWTGSAAGSDAANDYVPQPPFPLYGIDGSVFQWGTNTFANSGLATRGRQLEPRAMLWSGGVQYNHYCVSFLFNPACDHPKQLYWRPETLVAQIESMLALNVKALRGYNFDGVTNLDYRNCCGWNSPGTGTGGVLMAPYTTPPQWSAMAHIDALIKLREDTELQPVCSKPYLGPYFITDCHASAAYGNEIKIGCLGESPYGAQTLALPVFAGGSVFEQVLDGYTVQTTLLAGNPATVTADWCAKPGLVTVYVALPAAPAVQPIDNIAFAPPRVSGIVALPFGASKFLVQAGYYPRAMQDDPVTDCTATCTIPVDHHNTSAWYRVIYADANSLPLSFGDPVQIPSQGKN